jgi:N-methylhydantoinase A
MIDVSSIGAGGGSIAWLDEAASLHVGPQSAGAAPGPVCYGTGGVEPTVTDASVVLGYLNPRHLVGGALELDADAAHRAIEALSRKLGLEKQATAAGIHSILNSHMADEIRLLTVKRGFDPREFALVMLGGAGPLHGGPLARALGIPRVIVPLAPGVLSAFGLLVSDIEHDHAMAFARPAPEVTPDQLAAAFASLDARGAIDLRRDRVDPAQAGVRRYADMRYIGQSYELEVELAGSFDDGAVTRLVRDFHAVHQRIYKQHNEASLVEFVNLRAVFYVAKPKPAFEPPPAGRSWEAAQADMRRVWFEQAGDYVETPVFDRLALPHGTPRAGPFILEQVDSTTVVFPGETARVQPHGNLVIEMPRHA